MNQLIDRLLLLAQTDSDALAVRLSRRFACAT